MNKWEDAVYYGVAALIALVVVALLVGFVIGIWQSIPQLTEGVVVDKTFSPAHTSTYTVMVRTGEVNVPSLRTLHYAASWRVKVNGVTDEGKVRTEWWEVGEAMYERIEIGDRVRRDPQTGVVSVCEGVN